MRLGFVLLFIAVPLIELALLIQLGSSIGFWPTIGIILLTAVVGTAVLQSQGFATMQKVSNAMARGEPPVEPIIDGMFLLVSGAFLLTPGILTDAVGMLLLIPQVRTQIRLWGLHRMMMSGNVHFRVFTSGMDKNDGTSSSAETPRPGGPRQEHTAPPSGSPSQRKRWRSPRNRGRGNASSSNTVIDGEYERLGDRTINPNRPRREN